MSAFPKYERYKDSGVEWLGEVPEHWEVDALRACAALSTERNRPDLPVLSVYREYGVIPKDSRDENHNATSLDTSNYKVVRPGDLAVNKMKAWQGSLGVSEHHGIVSPAYITCRVNQEKVNGRYLHYLLRSKPLVGALDSLSYGVRVGQWNMRFEDFKQIRLTYPPKPEQARASPSKPEQARASPSKPEQARASPSKPEQARASPSKPEQARASPSKPEQARASPSKPEQARASPSKPEQARASPSKPEQARIVAFLDRKTEEIDALIAKKQRQIELLDEQKAILINHTVTRGLNPEAKLKPSGIEWIGDIPEHWEVKRVKHQALYFTSGSRGWGDFYSDEGELFLQSGDLTDNCTISLCNAKRVKLPRKTEGLRTRLQTNDTVVCITGANTGRVANVGEVSDTIYVNQHLCLVRPSSEIDHRYLSLAMSGGAGRTHFSLCQYGLKEGLNLDDVKNCSIAIPPRREQVEILEFIDDVSSAIDEMQRIFGPKFC